MTLTPQPWNPCDTFLNHGSPCDSSDRFFLYAPGPGIDAIDLSEGRPLVTLKRREVRGLRVQVDGLRATSHRNLVNLKNAFLDNDAVSFVYELASVSFKEIREVEKLRFGIAETLNGLIYIHDELGIRHSKLTCDNIFITDEGAVKIANIGESMIRAEGEHEPSGDVQDVLSRIC
ncbi:hypothetical protein V1515DRAFT_468534 [Lipomyces mesembrius]